MRFRKPTFQDAAGAITAVVVVVAFLAIGFVQIAVKVATGVEIEASEAWMSAVSSLASAALGFLIGRNDLTGSSNWRPQDPPYQPLPPVAIGCNVPGCPMSKEGPQHESS